MLGQFNNIFTINSAALCFEHMAVCVCSAESLSVSVYNPAQDVLGQSQAVYLSKLMNQMYRLA